MIYPYIVVKDGVWYDAGNDVPETSRPETEKEKADSGVATHTKTEINRMSTDDLKALAISEGIDNAENMTGGALKEVLIAHFAL
nr:MAG TPA: Rho termination factor, N-terminal domain [Bacteriophage sp.]